MTRLGSFVRLTSGGDATEVTVFESVGVAFEGDDFGVVDEPVDHGGGHDVVAEDLAPPAEWLVGGAETPSAWLTSCSGGQVA